MSGVIRPKITKPLPTLAVGTPVRRRKFAKRYGVQFDTLAGDPTIYCRRAELQVL